MTRWHHSAEELDRGDMFDPLCVERSAPLKDEEAAAIEALCHAATPGPLVVDDEAEGDAAPVVSLPDGRMIVSLTAGVGHVHDDATTDANAQLICKARYLLLRLLRDREQWKQQRECLLEKIRTLHTELGREDEWIEGEAWNEKPHFRRHPR
jgi:hypothetical protein